MKRTKKIKIHKGKSPSNIYKVRPFRITPDFSTETLKARRDWIYVVQTLRNHSCQLGLLYKTFNHQRWRKQDILLLSQFKMYLSTIQHYRRYQKKKTPFSPRRLTIHKKTQKNNITQVKPKEGTHTHIPLPTTTTTKRNMKMTGI